MKIQKMSRQTCAVQQGRLCILVLLLLTAKFVSSADPTLKNCMEEQQEVSDSSYSAALAYFQKCLDLGKSVPREKLPAGYFNKVVENMRQSFEDFLEDSGLGEEQLAVIRKELRELSGEIRHVPRKKSSKPPSKDSLLQNETAKGDPKKISNKAQSKTVDNSNTTAADQPETALHLEVVNNIWPLHLYDIKPAEEQLTANLQEVNSTNSSVHSPLKKCGSNKNANGVEVLTLLLCLVTLAVCSWMAYKIYCQYQLWARVRYEASNHKTETTPLNQSESCSSTKNEGTSQTGKKRGFLP